jgi:hypothetical protein
MALTAPSSTLTGQTIAASYDQVLFLDAAAGVTEATLKIVSGTAGKTALQISDEHVLIKGVDTNNAAGFEVQQTDGTSILKVAAGTPAATLIAPLTVGADGSGHDVILYSDTSGDNFTWDASAECLIITGTDGAQALKVADGDLVVVDKIYLYDDDGGEYISGDGTDLTITSGTDILLAAGGNIGIGITTMSAPAGADPKVQIEGTDADNSGLSIWRNTAGASGPYLTIGHSRGSGLNSVNALVDNDILGTIQWSAGDGSDRSPVGANIFARIDGDPASNDMPTELVFGTTADGGSAAPTERMIIDKAGHVGIGESSPDEMLHLTSATSEKPVIKLENTNNDANSASIEFHKTSTDEADNDTLGTISWTGVDSGNAVERYAYIAGQASDITANDEAGKLSFIVNVDAAETQLLAINGMRDATPGQAEVVVNEDSVDCDFRVESNDQTHMLIVDGGTNKVGIGGITAPSQLFHVEGASANDWVSRIKTTTSTSGQSYGLQVIAGTNASDVSFAVKNQANDTTYLEVQGDGKVGIGESAPDTALYVADDNSGSYAATFFNDGNNADRYGIKVNCGADTPGGQETNFIKFFDGNNGAMGGIRNSTNVDLPEFFEGSDARIKDGIKDTNVNALSIFNNLKLREYTKKGQSEKCKIGLVAQETLDVFPELVAKTSSVGSKWEEFIDDSMVDEGGNKQMYAIGTGVLPYYLIKAVQELSTANDELKARIEVLENA